MLHATLCVKRCLESGSLRRLDLNMIRRRSESGWRATALAAALFAITLNFLQPLAHAALMRDGGPAAAAQIWGAFCVASEDAADGPATADRVHECCLGLAHAPAIAAPPTAFVLVERIDDVLPLPAESDIHSAVGIRDGPSQPRAPPFFV